MHTPVIQNGILHKTNPQILTKNNETNTQKEIKVYMLHFVYVICTIVES